MNVVKRYFFLSFLALICLGVGLVLSYGGEDSTQKPVAGPSSKSWTDSQSGLTWQAKPTGGRMTWDEAKLHCKGLSLAGHRDWRLPTINELRSLVRGCPAAQTGGSCGVTDSCLNQSCWNDDPCRACADKGGPGTGGAYWPAQLSGKAAWHWSSSAVADLDGLAWSAGFDYGVVFYNHTNIALETRCVRRPAKGK